MAHRAVEVDGIAGTEAHRRVDARVHLDLALEHVRVFLARVSHQFPELLERAGAQLDDDRNEPLVEQLCRRINVGIGLGFDRLALARARDAASTLHRGTLRCVVLRAEQAGKVHLEAGADSRQLVVGQRNPVVLDLRKRRDRIAGAKADFLEGPAALNSQRFQHRPGFSGRATGNRSGGRPWLHCSLRAIALHCSRAVEKKPRSCDAFGQLRKSLLLRILPNRLPPRETRAVRVRLSRCAGRTLGGRATPVVRAAGRQRRLHALPDADFGSGAPAGIGATTSRGQ